MIFTGQNINQSHFETLQKTTLSEIIHSIKSTENELYTEIIKLRNVKKIDKKVYDSLKKNLPYFIGSTFRQNLRKTTNFISLNIFVLDVDHCYEDESQFISLRNDLAQNKELLAMFTSPGGDGLKLLFKLKEPCLETKIFSDFYKKFAFSFSEKYRIESKIDMKTNDVTRVCFLSHDPYAYYNPVADKIDLKRHIPQQELLLPGKEENEYVEYTETSIDKLVPKKGPDQDVYTEILKKLNPGRSTRRPKSFIVPEILETIVRPISNLVRIYNFEIKEVRNINYGKKFIFTHNFDEAELNIFYGKKGFSIVKSPRNGTNPEFNELVLQMVSNLLYDHTVDLRNDPN